MSLAPPGVSQASDWLIDFHGPDLVAGVSSTTIETAAGPVPGLVLGNGLLSRTFALAPCFATLDLTLAPSRTRFVRALAAEASLSLDGLQVNVGGCFGQVRPEFLEPALATLQPDPNALAFTSYEVTPVVADFAWTPGTRWAPNVSWPPSGVHLTAHFAAPAAGLPDPNSPAFSQWYPNTELLCGGPNHDQCLQAPGNGTGFGCDNTTVNGQCSFNKSVAHALCAAWPACAGLNCNPTMTTCEARGAPIVLNQFSHYNCSFRLGPDPRLAGVDVAVHYEMYDGLPVYKKWVTVSVATEGRSLLVDNVVLDLMRAPNFSPEQVTVFMIEPENPTPTSQQVVPDLSMQSPSRTQQFWFFDEAWDACCDQQLHVGFTYYTSLRLGYGYDVIFGNTTGPSTFVTAATPFTSIAARLLFHDSTDWERQGLATRRMQTYLAPQLRESPLHTMLTDISTTDIFHLGISQAAAAGMDFVIVGFGANGYCGMCPEQLTNAT